MPKPITLTPGVVADLPLGAVRPDPLQPRKDFTDAALAELADNIRARGVRQPITVRPDPDKPGAWLIKTGERRWRASKVAGKKTIPALLDADHAQPDPLQVAFDQVAENHHRADLNPMEYAAFLCRLRDEFGMSVRDIEARLKEQGVHNMQRSYLSNIMRLVNLPDWAQARIRKGTLTAAHGKYLLAGIDSPAVMEELGRQFKGAIVPTTREIQEAVLQAFERTEILLDPYTNGGPRFDVDTCKGCKSLKRIASPYEFDEPGLFCLNPTCYQEKQDAAKTALLDKTAGQPAPVQRKAGVVTTKGLSHDAYKDLTYGVPFDIAGCEGCPNNRLACCSGKRADAEPHCFDMVCYKAKAGEASRANGRRERIEAHVEAWLRDRIAEAILANETAITALILYLACNCPGNVPAPGWKSRPENLGRDAGKRSAIAGLDDCLAIVRGERVGRLSLENDLALASLAALDRWHVVRLAKRLSLDVRDFRVDEAYLKILNKDGLKALLASGGVEVVWDRTKDLRDACLLRVNTIGVPPEVQHFFDTGDSDERKSVSWEDDGLDDEDEEQLDWVGAEETA